MAATRTSSAGSCSSGASRKSAALPPPGGERATMAAARTAGGPSLARSLRALRAGGSAMDRRASMAAGSRQRHRGLGSDRRAAEGAPEPGRGEQRQGRLHRRGGLDATEGLAVTLPGQEAGEGLLERALHVDEPHLVAAAVVAGEGPD